ncbi:MAG: occludin [Mediterranea sp.]|jgi:hypothetical protein|nr:occludin [Mediterranea sp.]
MRKLILFFGLVVLSLPALAQSEVPADTLRRTLPPTLKEYGGFLIDMGLMNVQPPRLPKFTLEVPDASKDYSRIFGLSSNVLYTKGFAVDLFSPTFSNFGSGWGWGLFSPFSTGDMQMSTFKLKSGWIIHTYGDYDKDGYRVPNPSAMPWERNNFRGAFELKAPNGSFGLRIQVQQGQYWLY